MKGIRKYILLIINVIPFSIILMEISKARDYFYGLREKLLNLIFHESMVDGNIMAKVKNLYKEFK